MFAQRHTDLEKTVLSAVAVLLLLTTAGQSATLTDSVLATATTPLSSSSLTTQLNNSTMEGPQVLFSHKPCGSENDMYCANGGTCIYPQDSEKPSCICTSSYSGPRCMLIVELSFSSAEAERLIGVIIGIIALIFFLALILYCIIYRRCVKSAPLKKSAPPETTV